MYGRNLYETLIGFEVRIDALVSRMYPLEKLDDNIDMAGKWLRKNTDRIRILEKRVGEIIQGDAHTKCRIDALEKTTWYKHTDNNERMTIEKVNDIAHNEQVAKENIKQLTDKVDKLEEIVQDQQKIINVIEQYTVACARKDILEATKCHTTRVI